MSQRPTHILWLDLETTGSAKDAEVIEVAVSLTRADPALDVLASFGTPVRPSAGALDAMPKKIVEMHTDNGLLADVSRRGVPLWVAESGILALLDQHGIKTRLPIGGSGVGHFDREMVRQTMPRLDKRLTYYTIDVGPTRRMLDLVGVKLPHEPKTHRASDCVREHLAEARRYFSILQAATAA